MELNDEAEDNENYFSDDNYERRLRKKRKMIHHIAVMTAISVVLSTIPLEPPRVGNCRNSRIDALQYARSWDDDMFRRQFRLCCEDFANLLVLISPLITRNALKAIASSGSPIPFVFWLARNIWT